MSRDLPTLPMMPTAGSVFTGANQISGNSYDPSGNQISFGGDTLSYDAENRMIQAAESASNGGGVMNYFYDGLGQRVEKGIVNSTNTVYVYDAFGQMVAEYSSDPEVGTPICATCYVSGDHLGSARLVTDASANIVARHDFTPFGGEVPGGMAGRLSEWGADDGVSQKFTGQERDSETGQDFFNARYFANAQGRFNSPDPVNAGADIKNPQSWNAYSYVLNNPLNATDPSGLCGGIVAGISSDPYHGGGLALLQIASQYGYDIAFPYAGQSKLGGILSVFGQSLGFKNGATATAAAMVQDVSAQTQAQGQNPLTSSFFSGWSGGAVAMQAGGVQGSTPQVYFSPAGAILPDLAQNQNALVFSGSGVLDSLVNATSSGSGGSSVTYPGTADCGHDAACMWNGNQAAIDNLITSNGVQSCPSPTVFLPRGIKIPLSRFGGGGSGAGWSPILGGGGGGWDIFEVLQFLSPPAAPPREM